MVSEAWEGTFHRFYRQSFLFKLILIKISKKQDLRQLKKYFVQLDEEKKGNAKNKI